MDGLEITEVRLSDIESSVHTFRIDSEYFGKQFLRDEALFRTNPEKFTEFRKLDLIVGGSAFYPSLEPFYDCGSLPFLRVADVDKVIDFTSCVKIPDEILPNFPTLRLVEKGDIVLTKGGSIGRAGLVTERAAVTRDLIFIDSSKLGEIDYTYLASYFQTDFAFRLMLRSSSLTAQPHLTITLIRDLPVLIASDAFKAEIFDLATRSQSERLLSEGLFRLSDDLLLTELGFIDWNPPENNISIKSFSESFFETCRLDAEYYSQSYDYAIEKLHKLKPNAIVPLGDVLRDITNGQTPLRHDLTEGEVVFLTAEHISDFRIDFDSDKRVETEHHQKQLAKTAVKKNDLLITIKGKIGNAAVVENVPSPTNINQDVGLLRLKDGVDPYYIAGYINSILGKMFTKRISTGQINPFLGLGNLRTIPIPIFDNANELGALIRAKVMDAERAASKSKYLLNTAKRAVEIAIEQNEDAAMEFIRQNS